jgi:hypothetical protein
LRIVSESETISRQAVRDDAKEDGKEGKGRVKETCEKLQDIYTQG